MNYDPDNPKLYGLLGKNISYSLSPFMHNAAFKHFNINSEYKIFDLREDQLETFVQTEMLTGKVSGVNVTVPYKIRMKEILEKDPANHLDNISKCIGALNTIRVDKEKFLAWNTDTWGFYHSLKEDAKFDLMNKNILILGAGGAGRAICLFLALMKISRINKISIYDIDKDRVGSILRDYNNRGVDNSDKLRGLSLPEELYAAGAEADLVVNATPLGTKEGDPSPIDVEKLKESVTVYDLVYARETELFKRAREKGLKASTGEGMLANQGAKAFYYWNEDILKEKDPELKITKEIMREVLLSKLGRK